MSRKLKNLFHLPTKGTAGLYRKNNTSLTSPKEILKTPLTMSDNTNQQRADQFDFPEPDTFVIVKNCVTKSQIAQDPNVPGLSEEQLKELPEALQAAVKTGKFADLKAVMMAMTREERSKLYDFIDAVCCFRDRNSFHDKWEKDPSVSLYKRLCVCAGELTCRLICF